MKKDNIGRNDPCPCGSGLKYKRCCGSITENLQINQSSDAIRFNRTAGYIGVVGHKREEFCRNYIAHKQKIFELISQEQAKSAASTGNIVACKKGCSSCCDEIIICSLQEGEGIVYYLYHNELALNSFIQTFPGWLAKVSRHEDIFVKREKIQSQGFDEKISFEEMQSKIGELSREYSELHISCPFLTNNACSIYEVRPWVCANLFATTKCDDSPEQKVFWLNLPPTIEEPFWDERIEVIYSGLMPRTIYQILTGGLLFLSKIPGLHSTYREYLLDPEVRSFAEGLKSR